MQEWFECWFDTKYYHQLYAHRNDAEAQAFMDQLVKLLELKAGARILDNACGRGRHARYLASKGFEVTGLDLSSSSIQYARPFETTHLHFYVHDMREVFFAEPYDVVFNLFTSFGYFKDIADDRKIISAIHQELNVGGYFVMDFFNSEKVKSMLVNSSIKAHIEIDQVVFDTEKFIHDGHVVKEIKVTDGEKVFQYQEQVKLWNCEELKSLIEEFPFEILYTFGNYQLEELNLDSDRCILVCRKKIQ